MTWLVATVACKLSILTLYLTLFRISNRFSISIYVTCACVVIYFVVYLPVQLTQCHPIDYGWNPVPGGGCRSSRATQISSIALNIVLDTVVAVLPITILWNLRMPLRTKIAIGTMFSLGLLYVAPPPCQRSTPVRDSNPPLPGKGHHGDHVRREGPPHITHVNHHT